VAQKKIPPSMGESALLSCQIDAALGDTSSFAWTSADGTEYCCKEGSDGDTYCVGCNDDGCRDYHFLIKVPPELSVAFFANVADFEYQLPDDPDPRPGRIDEHLAPPFVESVRRYGIEPESERPRAKLAFEISNRLREARRSLKDWALDYQQGAS
jgi:hypothetical protein